MRASYGCMWTCDCLGKLGMSGNENVASKTVEVLAAETNHAERLHGLEV